MHNTPEPRPLSKAAVILLVMLAYSGLSAVAGGYVSARLAPSRPMLHAMILGGIALAPAPEGALVVWSAIDEKVPQVFATLVDAQGKRLHQAMITRSTKFHSLSSRSSGVPTRSRLLGLS